MAPSLGRADEALGSWWANGLRAAVEEARPERGWQLLGGLNEVGFKGFSHQTVTCLIGKIETSDSYREIKAFKNFQKFNCINTGVVYLYKSGYLLM